MAKTCGKAKISAFDEETISDKSLSDSKTTASRTINTKNRAIGAYFTLSGKRNIQPYFLKGTVLSYQITMPSYSTEFENLEHKDVERWKNHATPPLICFLSEWRNSNDHGAPTQQSTLLKVEPKSWSANADTYKFSYELFEDGNVEDLIRFLDAFEEIFLFCLTLLSRAPLNGSLAYLFAKI